MQISSYLEEIHPNPRDKLITLDEKDHVYTVNGCTDYKSVTKFVDSVFPHFDADKIIEKMMKGPRFGVGHKYWGMTPDEIKKQWSDKGLCARTMGTSIHEKIEWFMNNPHAGYALRGDYSCSAAPTSSSGSTYTQGDLVNYFWQSMEETDALVKILPNIDEHPEELEPEWKQFLAYAEDWKELVPYRTEWKVFYEEFRLCGCIDMMYLNPDGTVTIADWKRCEVLRKEGFGEFGNHELTKHLPNTNYWHYVIQLSIYKFVIEEKYGLKVTNMFLVQLHRSNGSYNKVQVEPFPQIKELLFSLASSNACETPIIIM